MLDKCPKKYGTVGAKLYINQCSFSLWNNGNKKIGNQLPTIKTTHLNNKRQVF